MTLSLKFDKIDIEYHPTCYWDHLTITDGDGTTLMAKSCGSPDGKDLPYYYPTPDVVVGGKSIGKSLPTVITSKTNVVKLSFKTDYIVSRPGWKVTFTAASTGEVIFQLTGFGAGCYIEMVTSYQQYNGIQIHTMHMTLSLVPTCQVHLF